MYIKKIKLLEPIQGYGSIFKVGDTFEEDEPDQGFNDDGSFTICQGMGIYINVKKDQFEII